MRLTVICCIALLALLFGTTQLHAHDITDKAVQRVGLPMQLTIGPGRATLDVWFYFGEMEAMKYRRQMDSDADGALSAAETDAFLADMRSKFLPDSSARAIRLYAGRDTEIQPSAVRQRIELVGGSKTGPSPIEIDYDLKDMDAAGGRLRLGVLNALDRTVYMKIEVLAEGVVVGSITDAGGQDDPLAPRQWHWMEASVRHGQPNTAAVPDEGKPGGQTGAQESSSDKLKRMVSQDRLPFTVVVVALLLALFWGGAHALSPGHGKAITAAYLIGSKATVKNAVVLGLAVTFTHVFSVIAVGVAALLASTRVSSEAFTVGLGLISGAIIIVIGLTLLVKRSGRGDSHGHSHLPGDGHEHSHGDGDGHGHSHVPPQGAGLKDLISLGISGGMVPCPTAIVVLMAAISMKRIAFGLAMITFFSAGLAAVLIIIGVCSVCAVKFVSRIPHSDKALRIMPVISAVLVILLGHALLVKTLMDGGVLRFDWPVFRALFGF
jgi:nickel/cobalt exporter